MNTYIFDLGLDGSATYDCPTLEEAIDLLSQKGPIWYTDPAIPGRVYLVWHSVTENGVAVDSSRFPEFA